MSLLQSGYFSSMFSGSWKESNMMEINLEIPDQNIDTEGERLRIQRAASTFTPFHWWLFPVLHLCSPSSGFWIPVSWWCPDQAQQGHQHSCCCLHAAAGQYTTRNYLKCEMTTVLSHHMFVLTGWLDPAVRWNHEGKHQCEECVQLLRLC